MSLFVGLDLHKVYSEFAVMDIFGNVLRQGRVENTLDKMREFSESLPSSSSVVMESSSTWYWAHRLLSERHNVTLSNPVRNKAIASAKVKTDKIDSTTLRSEEHTSELQSRLHLVCRLLLEKKNTKADQRAQPAAHPTL